MPFRLLLVRRLLCADIIAIAAGNSQARNVLPFGMDVERWRLPEQREMSARISVMVAQVGKVRGR